MRNNQPVNNIEHRMNQHDVLVSKTDLKGKITYANADFCKIAGLSEEELIGQPHNIVRHPDMPPEAFDDLWKTLKAGQPWIGYVKNRSADGGFYWVKANVAPEFDELGKTKGYISVRSYPTDAEIKQASELYADIRSGKVSLPETLAYSWHQRLSLKSMVLSIVTMTIVSFSTVLGSMLDWFTLDGDIRWVLLVALGLSLVLQWRVLHDSIVSLHEVISVLKAIVANKFDSELSKKSDNETAEIKSLIKIIQSKLSFEIFEARKSAERQQTLDEERKEEERLEDLALANIFESEVGSLISDLGVNASSIHDVMTGLTQVADRLNDQSVAAQASVRQSSDYVGTTAAAIEELSISISSVVTQVDETLNVSKQAVEEAKGSAQIMEELQAASEEIGSVVATINDIAEQTNLLALNANIEAARAGDAGRGFAVVAGEVKELANQTSQATGRIRKQVEHIQIQSRDAGSSIGKIQAIIEEVNKHSSHVASAMDQQNEATREMSSGAQYANSSMQEAQASVGEVSVAANEVEDSSVASLKRVDGMMEQMKVVQSQVEAFVRRLKG